MEPTAENQNTLYFLFLNILHKATGIARVNVSRIETPLRLSVNDITGFAAILTAA